MRRPGLLARGRARFFAGLGLGLVGFYTPAYAGDGEVSALEMRQKCRGVEAAEITGTGIRFNVAKYPEALTCWGAFNAIGQAAASFYGEANDPPINPIFLPGVCPTDAPTIKGAPAPSVPVLVRVFTRYVDARPREGDRPFMEVAWEALKDAWPCPKTAQRGVGPAGKTISDIESDGMFGCQHWEVASRGTPNDAELRSGECTRFAKGETVYTERVPGGDKWPNNWYDVNGNPMIPEYTVQRVGGGPAYYVVGRSLTNSAIGQPAASKHLATPEETLRILNSRYPDPSRQSR